MTSVAAKPSRPYAGSVQISTDSSRGSPGSRPCDPQTARASASRPIAFIVYRIPAFLRSSAAATRALAQSGFPDETKRGFCAICGSSVAAIDHGDTPIDINTTALDNQDDPRLLPVNQSFRNHAVPWLPQIPNTRPTSVG